MHDPAYGVQTTLSAQYGFGREANNTCAPKLVQPADPLTDRIQKALSEISSIIAGAEDDPLSVDTRLFGERIRELGSAGANAPAESADQAIAQSLAFVAQAAARVRQLAAELNGRI